jgi:catechol 2,3-dioxygenase-like lactoylglutathione lyase family enzyme
MDSKIISQTRISRPTNQLGELLRFYRDGLGMKVLVSFEPDAAGYSGMVLAFPHNDVHLEFVIHKDGFSNCAPPTADNLIVFFIADWQHIQEAARRLESLGYLPVKAANPHWDQDGLTFADPDGWRIVLMKRSNV